MLLIRCPKCDSQHIRASLAQSTLESVAKLFGYAQFRCLSCDHRFGAGLLDVRNLPYARCPLCYRLDLSLWRPEKYILPVLWRVLLSLGAKPHRCEACRKNFVSFLPAKARYVRRKIRSAEAQTADH